MEPIQNSNSCYVCHKPDNNSSIPLMKCSACKAIFYCSVDHQKKDWMRHKPECSTLAGRITSTPVPSNKRIQLSAKQENVLLTKLTNAEVLRKNNQITEALKLYQEIAESMRTISSANIGMGICYSNLHDYEKALEQFNLVLKTLPQHEECLIYRADISIATGRMEEAKLEINKIIQLNSSNPALQILLRSYNQAVRGGFVTDGIKLFEEFRYEEALALFQKGRDFGIKTKTHQEVIDLFIGMCHVLLNQDQKALESLDLFVETTQISDKLLLQTYVITYRAVAKINLNKIQEAREDIASLKLIDPKNIIINSLMGLAFAKESNYLDAIKCYMKFYNSPELVNKSDVKNEIIRIAPYLENRLFAEACLNKILLDDPQCYKALEAKGCLNILRNNAEEARKCLDKSIEICSTWYSSFARRASLNMDEGRFEEAKSDCAQALMLIKNENHDHPDLPVIEQLFANIVEKKQRCEDTLTLLKLSGIQPVTLSIPNFAELLD